jgi:hypothetical protein
METVKYEQDKAGLNNDYAEFEKCICGSGLEALNICLREKCCPYTDKDGNSNP